MTPIYIILILLQAVVIVYFVKRGKKQAPPPDKAITVAEDTYEGHRKLAISITPQQLNLNIPENETFVYGLVMDWNTGDSVVTLATYINGAANLYLSSGGGVQGAGKNPIVGEAAVKLVATAQEYVASAMPVSVAEIPAKDCVRFYLLTNKSIYAAQEQVKYFDNSTSAWLPLFMKGNQVITEMMN